ncbi:cupin fold metalloprotein, WbuC family [Leptolyngbyaceae cyanobacterium CCMR0082]|uniref:Cupin fold metalloprotein, WbuC family n=1 Tax=Adonisia turfae CCMR0082 TaxID=2304604 RepID=A0A6M0SCA9_9CYAN|nr:WbuC family cupin fold metalloprotein [Adonisia turfae]NEZ66114.1 cupin fold metalloprotein, WbuC family [Adonisia turfae CCMR0082]
MPTVIKRVSQELFDSVSQEASALPRLRKNHNLHQLPDSVQRFINVLQPGTYVRPHRHLRAKDSNGFELFLVLQGEIGFLMLNEQGQVIQIERLCAQGPTYGLELAEGQYHTLIALAPNTVMFEIKEGPYVPAADKDFMQQFPAEGTVAAQQQVQAWAELFSG